MRFDLKLLLDTFKAKLEPHSLWQLRDLLPAFDSPDPGGDDNMVVLLMRLQRCENPESLREWVGDADKAGLASAFAAWIAHVRLPELGVADALSSDTPEEVLEMLETEPRTWADRIREKGHAEGLKRGSAGIGVGAETAASASAGPIRKAPGAKLGLSPGGSHGRERAGRDRRVAAGQR